MARTGNDASSSAKQVSSPGTRALSGSVVAQLLIAGTLFIRVASICGSAFGTLVTSARSVILVTLGP